MAYNNLHLFTLPDFFNKFEWTFSWDW